MGKFNWRAGLALASAGARQNLERKREYERDDEKMAMGIAQQLAQQGMPIPENYMKKIGPYTRELVKKYQEYLPEMQKKQLKQEMDQFATKYETQKNIDWLYDEPTEKPKSSDLQMFETFAGMSMDEVKKLPNDMRRKLFSDYSSSKRKEDKVKTIRPRYQILKNESTGKVERIDVDTGETTVVKPESPELMEKARKKEEAEKKKQDQQNTIKATKLYQDWIKGDKSDPQALSNVNTLLSEFGYQITPIINKKPYAFDTTDYQLGKIGATAAPQAIKDPSQMTDEELAAEVERIKRGQ